MLMSRSILQQEDELHQRYPGKFDLGQTSRRTELLVRVTPDQDKSLVFVLLPIFLTVSRNLPFSVFIHETSITSVLSKVHGAYVPVIIF